VEGGQELWVDADLDSMPIFVKEGAIIPKYPIQQYVGEKTIDEITLDIYYAKGKQSSQIYEDAHDGYDYIKGRYSLRNLKLIGSATELSIHQYKSGKYVAPFETLKLKLHGFPFKVSKVKIDKEEFDFDELKVKGENAIVVDKDFTEVQFIK
jgi:alpha-glucosidase